PDYSRMGVRLTTGSRGAVRPADDMPLGQAGRTVTESVDTQPSTQTRAIAPVASGWDGSSRSNTRRPSTEAWRRVPVTRRARAYGRPHSTASGASARTVSPSSDLIKRAVLPLQSRKA